jgi:hypothetical protein
VQHGPIFEATKLGLSRWFLAMHLLSPSKKGDFLVRNSAGESGEQLPKPLMWCNRLAHVVERIERQCAMPTLKISRARVESLPFARAANRMSAPPASAGLSRRP